MTAEERITELQRENLRLILFYSQLMDSLHKETIILKNIPVQYKVVENEDYLKLMGGVKPLKGF